MTGRPRALGWTGLVLVTGIVAAAPRAAATPSVAIAVDALDDVVAIRLGAELRELGFAVAIVQAPEAAPSRELLEATARDRGAVAAFRIVRSRSGVEVWIFDRLTGKTVLREVIVGEEREPTARAALIATRAVELLRASLLELAAPHQVLTDMEVPRAARALVAPPRRKRRRPGFVLTLTAGPAAAVSPGGVGPSLHALVELGARLSPTLRASVVVALPVAVDTVEADSGRAAVAPFLAGAALTLSLRPFTPWLRSTLRAGLGAAFLRMEGETPVDGAVGLTDTTASLWPFAGGAVRLALGRRAALVAAVDLGLALPQPVIRFLDEQVAFWGMPLFLGTLALEIEGP